MRIDRYSFDESFRAIVEITNFHGDASRPFETMVTGRLLSMGGAVPTAANGHLAAGQRVLVLMTNPANGNLTIGDLMKGSSMDGAACPRCQIGAVVEFFGCELLNDDEIDARSFIVQRAA